MEETPVPLPKHIHWDRQRTNPHLHTRNRHKHRSNMSRNNPVKALERQGEREDVLEDEKAGEGFNRHLACTIH